MGVKIPKYNADLRYFCVWTGGFTKDEVDQIEFLENLQSFQAGKLDRNHQNKEIRDSEVSWIHRDENTNWLFERASGIVSKANYDHFMFDIDGFDVFQYTKYGDDQHYDWHWDLEFGWSEYERKISWVMLLSDPEEYEGGEFEIVNHGNFNDTTVMKPKRGDVVLFASWMPHRVRPVTSGTRKSLVAWVMGKRQV